MYKNNACFYKLLRFGAIQSDHIGNKAKNHWPVTILEEIIFKHM